jgi:iron complex outermembrane receptor protein
MHARRAHRRTLFAQLEDNMTYPRITMKLAVAVATAFAAGTASSQQLDQLASTDAADSPRDPLEAIVVIGSNRSDASGGLDASAPVRVLTAQQLEDTGAATLNEALSRLEPSFQFPQGQNAVKGMGIRSAELRGVSPAYTLVLVNGKRRHTTAQLTGTDPWPAATVVDINTIPLAAIERIEVLKDGAAAQYGSDAISGVVNIVLRNKADGGDVDARVGGYTDGGGLTGEVNAWKGIRLGERANVTLSANFLQSGQVDRTAPDWRQLFPNGDPRLGVAHPDAGWQWGQGSRLDGSLLANGEWNLAEHTTAYGWLGWSHESTNNYINPERVVKTNNNPTAATLAQYGPTAPSLINQYSDFWRYSNGYQPDTTYDSADPSAAAGVRFGDVDAVSGKWDVGFTWGENETQRWVHHDLNPSWGANSPTSGYLGSWRARQESLTADVVKAVPLPGLKDPVLLNGGVLARREYWGVGDVGDAWTYTPGALTAAGINTVGQLYTQYPGLLPAGYSAAQLATIQADHTLIPTVSDFAGIWPADVRSATRDVRGLYLGAESQLGERLQLAATGRYEHYSDFGSTVNGKLTGRWEWSPTFALRGTVSSGFHAPSLAELAYQSTGYTGTLVNGGGSSAQVLGLTRQFYPTDPAAAVFGARALRPEESTNYALGIVLKPNVASSVTVDAYELKIRHAIQVSESLSGNGTGAAPAQGTVIGNLFNAEGLNGFTTASFYLNAWDQTTRGVDTTARLHIDQALAGALDLGASLSLLDTYVPPGSLHNKATIGGNTFTVISNAKVRDAEFGTPRSKFVVYGTYTRSQWTIDTTVTRYGQYRYDINATNGATDQVFSPETYLDLDARYRFTQHAQVALGANNLLNRYPDPYLPGNRQSGVNKYSFIAPNGAAGRFVYLALNYSL